MEKEWIKVTDSLPDNENYCLVYTSSGDYDLAFYKKVQKKWYWNAFDILDNCDTNQVTHWQPLKSPYMN